MSEAPSLPAMDMSGMDDFLMPPHAGPFLVHGPIARGELFRGGEVKKDEDVKHEADPIEHGHSSSSNSSPSHKEEGAEVDIRHHVPGPANTARRPSSASTLASSTSPDTPTLQLLDVTAEGNSQSQSGRRPHPLHEFIQGPSEDAVPDIASAISTVTEHLKAADAAEARNAWLLLQAHFALKKEH